MSSIMSFFRPKSKKGQQTEQQRNSHKKQENQTDPLLAVQLQQSLGNQMLDRRLNRQNNIPDDSAVGAASTVLSASEKTPEQQRQEEIDKERDQQAPSMAQRAYSTIRTETSSAIHMFLVKDKKTRPIRDSMKRAAISAVQSNMDKVAGTDEQKADAKAFADSYVEKDNVVFKSLGKYAFDTIAPLIKDSRKIILEERAKAGFDEVKANTSVSIDKQISAAHKQADKYTRTKASSIIEDSVEISKNNILNQMNQDLSSLGNHIDIGDLGVSEAKLREQLDNQLVEDTTIDTMYSNKLYEPIKQAVLMKLGVGRRAWRRSKELNVFRQKMKDASRDQSNENIDNKLDHDALTSSKSDVGKKYYGMLAKTKAYSLSKTSVNTAMETEAGKITSDVLPADPTKSKLKQAAKTSAYSVARVDQSAKKKINEAALSGARTRAIAILKETQTIAVNEARKITKGDKNSPSSKADTTKQNELSTTVREQVTTDDIAGQSIKQAIEADNLNSGLAKAGKVIDLAVPTAGDSSSFEFELKIPVEQTGSAYVLFGLGAEAEREDDELAVNSQITFGAGFQTFGLDANFRVGLYIEAQGTNSTNVMNLISYGLYRHMRTISSSAADYFWGQSGKSGMSKVEEAELWAAMIEEQDLSNEDNYVDVGLIAALQAEVNAGVVEMGGSLSYKRLNRYDKDAIEDKGKAGFGDETKLDQLKEKAKNIKSGTARNVYEAAAEVGVEIGSNDVSFGLEGSVATMNGKVRELEIAASGAIPFQYGEDTAQWAQHISKWAIPIAGGCKNIISMIRGFISKDKDADTPKVGSGVDAGTDLLFTIPQFDDVGNSLAEKIQDDETINDTVRGWLTGDSSASPIEQGNKIALSSQLELSIGFSKEWDDAGAPSEWEISIEVSQTKGFEVDAGIVRVAVEKSKRLGRFSFGREVGEDISVGGGLLGIEK